MRLTNCDISLTASCEAFQLSRCNQSLLFDVKRTTHLLYVFDLKFIRRYRKEQKSTDVEQVAFAKGGDLIQFQEVPTGALHRLDTPEAHKEIEFRQREEEHDDALRDTVRTYRESAHRSGQEEAFLTMYTKIMERRKFQFQDMQRPCDTLNLRNCLRAARVPLGDSHDFVSYWLALYMKFTTTQGIIDSYTGDDLKAMQNALNLPTSGNKSVQAARLRGAFYNEVERGPTKSFFFL